MKQTYDLFVIGGGINGAAVACDAAGRGLSVGLAEMRDFSEGTSSRSSKLIHGGLRYLETYDFKLVREALLEREILMSKAPHLVRPLRLVLPHVPGLRPRWMLRLGLFLYDHIVQRKTLPGSVALRLDRHPAGNALKDTYRHGFAYSDCRGDDSRLVIANLLGAQDHGADIFPRHRFSGASRSQGLWRITTENVVTGQELVTRARALVNAAGPWVIKVTSDIQGITANRRLRMVRGSHIVVPRQWDGPHGYFLQTRDGRLMETFPYEDDFISIGTTDEPWDQAPEDVAISDEEIDYMIEETNRYLRKPIGRDDIVWSYSGVRPLFEIGAARDGNLSTLTRDYSFEVDHDGGEAPVLIIFGGKLTTHRRMAEHALTELGRFLRMPKEGRTAVETLPGGDFGGAGIEGFERVLAGEFGWLPGPQLRRYVKTYGTRSHALLNGARSLDDLGPCFGADLYQKEVDFLIDTEWAKSTDDIIWRRTKLGLRLGKTDVERLAVYLHSLEGAAEGRNAR
jgi:glycerol-3-phosphate dehydrogenase